MTRPTELCQIATDWRGHVPLGGMLAQEKKDGWRAARFPGLRSVVNLWTRGGFVIEGTGHILAELDAMEARAGEKLVFDGEFQVGGTLAATKRWCERDWKLGGTAGVYHIFDVLPLADWREGECSISQVKRLAWLAELCAPLSVESPVQLIPHHRAYTKAEIVSRVKQVWADGGEGIVLKDPNAPYQRKKSDAWEKVKRENMAKWN